MPRHSDKWTAFLLSLVAPGTGQLFAGSFTCVAWFLAAGLLASVWLWLADGNQNTAFLLGQFITLAALGVCSAEHAKRLLEPMERPRRQGNQARVGCVRRTGRSIDMRIELDVPLPVSELWRRVADLPRFLTIDPFHERVTLMRDAPAAGVDLVLWHNAFGRRFARFGRILSWREGQGYTFSDLSPRGGRRGFPHVFCLDVLPCPEGKENHSRLTIGVKGKWTSPWVPAPLGRLWIWLVCSEHARLLRKGL